jgi:hypothetical protein
MRYSRRTIESVAIMCACVLAAPVAAQSSTVIRGIVRDSASRRPVPFAEISNPAAGIVITSDTAGHFLLSVPAADTLELTVHRIGFTSRAVVVHAAAGDTVRLDVALSRSAHALDSVTITAREQLIPAKYRYTTRFDRFFEDRQSSTAGKFFTREQLEQYGTLARTFRSIAGVRVREGVGGYVGGLTFAQCSQAGRAGAGVQPTLIINGVHHQIGDLGTLNFEDVELMEVFRSIASAPADARGSGCGAVVIFTRAAP